MKINYFEENGMMCFSLARGIYNFSGKIPKKIQARGKRAIKKYVEEKVKTKIRKQDDKTSKQDQFAKNPNFPVAVEYKDVTLRGKIISADNNILKVRLEKPYTGESDITFGFGSAMSGRCIFNKSGNFSEEAIASAQKLLIKIYERKKHCEKHGKAIDLARQLNY